MFKNRSEELRVAAKMSTCYSDKIIPLFEILNEEYETQYQKDPVTQAIIYEQKNGRNYKVKEAPTEADIITLQKLSSRIGNRRAFIDYFRFSIKKYGSDVAPKKVSLSFRLNNDDALYLMKIKEVCNYANFIPTVSIKQGFDMKVSELYSLIKGLQRNSNSVALRITEEWISVYGNIIETVLRPSDYLLFDIGEQTPKTKIMEFEEIKDMACRASIILLNSPRKADINNGKYEDRKFTALIDNSARDEVNKYNFSGYGDYCGLKDALPSSSEGNNGTGAALALLYCYNGNQFMSYVNIDTTLGMRGYKKIISDIKKDIVKLDPKNVCLAIKEVLSMTSTGNWRTWINLTATRYIHQVYLNI